ncbi:MAG: hypothetical protein DMD29_04315 [Gemmatimonadetes bacterium]|nr:MAG: hypothetical protein AUH68_00370 [Gemmatimonadetes bacterium 13_1_40CM_4_69_5]PYO42014.1 MAG: hypothetical protein DMD29_04315 [Gemmatimonadota bacterium]
MSSVKDRNRPKQGPVAERLAILLDLFSPWEAISLTYRQFAAEIGPPVTEAAVKKWPQRKKFPADIARLIVVKAQDRGVTGVTLEWLLWGDGETPRKTPRPAPVTLATPTTPQGPHGRSAARIAEALQADLSHNEFGQWSSVEVQRTVTWALKDLARRLRVLRFDMGRTFELTDEWAGQIGLPVRGSERLPEGEAEDA